MCETEIVGVFSTSRAHVHRSGQALATWGGAVCPAGPWERSPVVSNYGDIAWTAQLCLYMTAVCLCFSTLPPRAVRRYVLVAVRRALPDCAELRRGAAVVRGRRGGGGGGCGRQLVQQRHGGERPERGGGGCGIGGGVGRGRRPLGPRLPAPPPLRAGAAAWRSARQPPRAPQGSPKGVAQRAPHGYPRGYEAHDPVSDARWIWLVFFDTSRIDTVVAW